MNVKFWSKKAELPPNAWYLFVSSANLLLASSANCLNCSLILSGDSSPKILETFLASSKFFSVNLSSAFNEFAYA